MNYELAKKLKDAGFPQRVGENGWAWCPYDEDGKEELWETITEFDIRCPTLSELIEACVKLSKDGDFHLEAMHDRWGASTCWKHSKDEWENGDTPEEAVANLWLKLNTPTDK